LEDIGAGFDILSIQVSEGAPVAGKTLSEVNFPRGALVLSEKQKRKIAGPEMKLEPGQSYVIAVEPDVSDEVVNLMGG
ncbi:MAG: TrkA C-terminal domain-containing protein, partial [Halobacteriaceae archaeon]